MIKKSFLYKQYVFFLVVIPLIIVLILLIVIFLDYKILQSHKFFLYKNETKKIINIVDNSFNYITKFSTILGKAIIDESAEDPDKIGKILQKNFSIAQISNDILTLTNFDFVNRNGEVVATTLQGALKEPLFVNKMKREWIIKAPSNPWKLHIDSHPSTGIVPAGQIIDYGIPVGIAINDNQDNFKGIISGGVDINKLIDRINSSLVSHNIKYVILNRNLDPIADSDREYINGYNSHFVNEVKSKGEIKSFEVNRKNSIKYKENEYFFIQKMDKYPFTILVGENSQALKEDIIEKILPSLTEIFAMLIFISALFYFFRSKLINPLINLSNLTKDISFKSGEVTIPTYDIYEIETLAIQLRKISAYTIQLNQSKNNLEDVRQKLKQVNQELEDKVLERTEKLTKALSAKTEFLNNMSHEVRTPIQGIVNISQGLVDHWEDYNNINRLSFAKKVAKNSYRLMSLVSNLLDLSKFSSKKMVFRFKNTNLVRLIQDMIEECQDLYVQEKEIKIIFAPEISVLKLECDKEKIIQLLRNLFSNAIKFTEKGEINVKLEKAYIRDRQGYRFSIEDTGIGIPYNEEKEIFDPFVQSSRTKTKAGGTGLGLAICKSIVEGHMGYISARNNYVVGTTIEFTIPRYYDFSRENNIIIDKTSKSIKNNNDNDKIKQSEFKDYSKSNFKNISYKSQHNNKIILLIDDEETLHSSLDMILTLTEYKLISAKKGTEGLEMLRHHKDEIDLVLLDLMMPDISGIDVLRKIRNDKMMRDTKVILQTGSSDQEEISCAKDFGVLDIIFKPYSKAKILEILDKFCI